MNFYKRLIFFSSGFVIGLLILSFFLIGKRASCSYLPNDRVIKNINTKKIIYDKLSDTVNASDSTFIKRVISSGRVDFSKSKIGLDSCNYYHIENKIDGKKYMVLLNNCDEYVLVDKFRELN
jgi:hypothetical protein